MAERVRWTRMREGCFRAVVNGIGVSAFMARDGTWRAWVSHGAEHETERAAKWAAVALARKLGKG